MTVTTQPSQDADRRAGGAPLRRAHRRRVGPALGRVVTPGTVHLLSLVLGYLGLLGLLRGTWFRGDDFEFLANRVGPDPQFSIWMPHNEHWSTAPILIWRVLYDVFGMSSVLPYLAASLAAHVLAAHLLWRLMRTAGVGAWISTGLSAAFVVLGAGHENITWAFQLGFMGSLALGFLALVLLARGGRGAFVAAVVVSLVSLTFSGISIVLVGMAVLYLLVVRRWHGAVVMAVVTGAVYLIWYAAEGRFAGRPPHPRSFVDRMSEAPAWSWRAVTGTLEAFFSAPGAGWLLFAAVVAGVTREVSRRRGAGLLPASAQGVLIAFAGGLTAQIGNLAINRGDISLPETPRYVYVFVALLLPLIGFALSAPWPRPARVLVGLLLGYLVLTQAVVFVASERDLEQPRLQSDVLGLAVLTDRGAALFPTELAVDVHVESVGVWAERGDLGDLRAVPEQAVADVRAQAQVVVTSEDPAVRPGTIASAGDEVVAGPCVVTETTPGDLAATLELTPDTTVAVVAPDGGELAYQVVEPGPASRLVTVPVQPNQTYWFTVAEPLTLDVVASQGQPLELCGA